MAKRFHDNKFDSSTLLKLEIFRGYIRKWLPVFLSKAHHPIINIYDFFAGPGKNTNDQIGSPLIIIDELNQYLKNPSNPIDSRVSVNLYFNDDNTHNIEELKNNVNELSSHSIVYNIRFENKDFETAFKEELPQLKKHNTANLVILDQCGLKQINNNVFRELISCKTTDIIFFISSIVIKRFITEGSIQQYFPLPEDEIKEVHSKGIHRYICNKFYRNLIPEEYEYHLAPFSIQKDKTPNIYGLIFGSGSLYGLQKFLEVCWNQDSVTGEANYNIDNDMIRDGQLSLFREENVIKKQDQFEKNLVEYIRTNQPTNKDIYLFTLENGFLSTHTNAILRELQKSKKLEVKDPITNKHIRKGAFYINWTDYNKPIIKAYFQIKGV